jgi:hypothetical protein
LLPTPVARDDGKTPEAHRQMKARLKGGPRTRITSLAVLARADFEQPEEPLLPTPSAWLGRRPENATADPERALSRMQPGDKGKRSIELPDALAMLPTPQARDWKGRNQRDDASCLPGAVGRLLPTPMANPENPGAGGELRAALAHGPERRNLTGVDSWGRPNRGRAKLLPTPTESDGDSAGNRTGNPDSKAHPGTSLTDIAKAKTGASTDTPSSDGPESSDESRPRQLTLADL